MSAKKIAIEWRVFDRSTNEKVEGVANTSTVNEYSEIQDKMLQKLSQNYQSKKLEKDLKIQNKLGASKNRGGYFIAEFKTDQKQYDIVIIVSVLKH